MSDFLTHLFCSPEQLLDSEDQEKVRVQSSGHQGGQGLGFHGVGLTLNTATGGALGIVQFKQFSYSSVAFPAGLTSRRPGAPSRRRLNISFI